MSFKTVPSLAEQIADYIREKIIRMELKPGESIREARLAEELNVSRSPIREALKSLEQQLLVEQTPRKGTKITAISESHIESLYDVTNALTVLVARKAVAKATPEDMTAIDKTVEAATKAIAEKDITGYYQAFFDFCLAILSTARDSLLEKMILDLLPSIRRMQFLTFHLRADRLEENLKIVQKGNQYLQKDNGEMAINTVIEYMDQEKAFALEALHSGLLPLDKQ
jgi:DNA-binding GntR family transcriptional regulator